MFGKILSMVAVVFSSLALSFGVTSAHASDLSTIYVVNHSRLSDWEVQDALPAFQAAVDEDFYPYWHVRATLKFGHPPKGAWGVEIKDWPNPKGSLGYHNVTPKGTPYAKVFVPNLDDKFTWNWQGVFSHEIFEMLADPTVDRFYNRDINHIKNPSPKNWIVEVADPVEGSDYYYTKDSASGFPVEISDFVTQNWYSGNKGKYDFQNKVNKPFEVLLEGYAVYQENGKICIINDFHPLGCDTPFTF